MANKHMKRGLIIIHQRNQNKSTTNYYYTPKGITTMKMADIEGWAEMRRTGNLIYQL